MVDISTMKMLNKDYGVTMEGKVYSFISNRFLKPSMRDGYERVKLNIGIKSVHRLVAQLFLEGESKQTVNHKDGNRTNNHVDNLEWATLSENVRHAYAIGNNFRGENHPQAKIDEETSNKIKNLQKIYGNKHKFIGEMLCVSRHIVRSIYRKKAWK